ncbi:hypothetical protein [Deinococcus hopiensis]|uniref:Uncharacterized protein n=1 Tax=Deinococcus hopiensis KR-140 TaxID=695939 RepID=A0A1W1UT06_9DEIO|nr:hypothetical protein [Deinococcus hopiensis]SMB84255.1 hypothetical protein SAMN00790413_05053 [Deinococcus hopiensis KR-140]
MQLNSALKATFQAFSDSLREVDPPHFTLVPNTLVDQTGATVRFVYQGVVLFLRVMPDRVTAELTQTSLKVYGKDRCEAAQKALACIQQSASGQWYINAVRAAQGLIAAPARPQYAAAQGM